MRCLLSFVLLFVVVIFRPTDARADSTPTPRSECNSLAQTSTEAWKEKDWARLLSTARRAKGCQRFAFEDARFSTSNRIGHIIQSHYHLGEFASVVAHVLRLQDVAEPVNAAVSTAKYAYLLLLGYNAAFYTGQSEAAGRFIMEARSYRHDVSPYNEALIYANAIGWSLRRGDYHLAISLSDEAQSVVTSDKVSPRARSRIQMQEARARMIYAYATPEQNRIYFNVPDVRALLHQAQDRLSRDQAVTQVHIDGLLAVLDAIDGKPEAHSKMLSVIDDMKRLKEAKLVDVMVMKTLAARTGLLLGRYTEALEILSETEHMLEKDYRQHLEAGILDMRAQIQIKRFRYDLAFLSVWRLWRMGGAEQSHTLDQISLSTLGMKGFAPWGIGAGLLLLGVGFIVVAGGRRLAQAIPDDLLPTRYVRPAVAEMHLASFGFPLFGRRSLPRDADGSALSPPASRRLRAAIRDRPALSPLLDDPVSRVLAAEPNAARALHLLNRTTGDAELLFHNLRETHVAAPPSDVTMALRLDDTVPPSGLREDGSAIYTCDVSGRSFAVTDGARLPVVHFDRGTDAAQTASGDGPARLVLHPEIVTAGPEAVLRSVAVAGALRILDGLDGLRDGTVIDRCLWGTDPADLAPLPMPDWQDV